MDLLIANDKIQSGPPRLGYVAASDRNVAMQIVSDTVRGALIGSAAGAAIGATVGGPAAIIIGAILVGSLNAYLRVKGSE